IVCFAINNMPTHAGLFNHIILIFLSISWGSLRLDLAFTHAVEETLSEWNSEADEDAYRDL
ncbi:hypothetical protein, partial [Halomonas ventosae]